jgi:lipid II:glycine glycyltransferase (peptidoglycan interpeptide bridge formation enzyme)
MTELTAVQWEAFFQDHPEAHILQSPTWGRLKTDFGWVPKYIQHGDLGAMVLFRLLPLGFSVAYIPRGPVGEGDWGEFWPQVDAVCKAEKAVFLRVEPEIWEPVPEGFAEEKLPGFQPSSQTVQPPRTVLVDLTALGEDLLMAMKSKTRYNIRLAARKDVVVQPSSDVAAFFQMMETTGERDAFGIHSLAYYQRAYELFSAEETCILLIASYQDQPLAGLMAFAWGDTAWYFYGASTNRERNRMPTYPLQWEAMRWARDKGCKTYDLWGIPDHPEEVLEDQFMDRSDGLWGVYRFKRGFGGEVRRTVGAWDRVYRPFLYRLYELYAGRNQTPSA